MRLPSVFFRPDFRNQRGALPLLALLGLLILISGILVTVNVIQSNSNNIHSQAAENANGIPTEPQGQCASSVRRFLANMGVPCDTTINVTVAGQNSAKSTATPQPTSRKTFNDLLK